ncbi:MAG: hypothetical protein JWP81_1565 [Ferruginibacter sp.]|nr:hypothetical protein [Ferruginibacter sp.]
MNNTTNIGQLALCTLQYTAQVWDVFKLSYALFEDQN